MKKVIFGLIATIAFSHLSICQNKFDQNSVKYYNFSKEIILLVKNGQISEEELENRISENSFKYISKFSNQYVNENQKIFEEIIKSDIDSLKLIEKKLLSETNNDPILEFLSYYKYILILNTEINYNIQTESRFCSNCWEMCTNICMNKKLKEIQDSNWIDQTIFVLTAPESTLQMYASCSWDCYKKYR